MWGLLIFVCAVVQHATHLLGAKNCITKAKFCSTSAALTGQDTKKIICTIEKCGVGQKDDYFVYQHRHCNDLLPCI